MSSDVIVTSARTPKLPPCDEDKPLSPAQRIRPRLSSIVLRYSLGVAVSRYLEVAETELEGRRDMNVLHKTRVIKIKDENLLFRDVAIGTYYSIKLTHTTTAYLILHIAIPIAHQY